MKAARRELLHSLKVGDVVDGVVTNVTDFGAFVDLGGLEGLIHVSELSWGRVNNPSDFLKVCDTVSTLVLQVSEDKGRIALSPETIGREPMGDSGEQISARRHCPRDDYK